jgi:hypothetical protein
MLSDVELWDGAALLAIFLICISTLFGIAGGIQVGRHLAPRQEHLGPANIDLLKDAAAIIGPGEPISGDLWRLAERMEKEEQ